MQIQEQADLLVKELQELIGVAVGEASMCWDPLPGAQVFDSTKASEIVDRVTSDVLRIIAREIDPRKKRK